MESAMDHALARALLDWQVESGVDEAIGDTPVDRYAMPAQTRPRASAVPAPATGSRGRGAPGVDDLPKRADSDEASAIVAAEAAAGSAATLEALRAALESFEHCELKRGARQLVFADGVPGSRVMIIGESPGRDEDRIGRPFVGQAGQLLDRMLDAIGLSRGKDVYIANILPWRPPQNRDPRPGEMAMMMPFMKRHVALAAPEALVLMGNFPCQGILGKRGITRLRGQWAEGLGLPVLPMFHPAYLLRNPAAKREAWADLLELNAWLGKQK